MMERKKRKKIFYVPGMISLVLIPFFCFYYFYKTDAFKVEGCMAISVSTKEEFENYKVKSLRKYKDFDFKQDKTEALKELRFFVRDLLQKYDTINGAKIHFDSKTDYNTYIGVINIIYEEKAQLWIHYKDDIYVLSSAKPKPDRTDLETIKYHSCRYYEENKLYFLEQERERQFQFIVSLYKKYWIIFLGYFGIVLLNLFRLVKFNKNQNYNQK
ncbi:hypothetical protein [Flavobacterium pectinovorum]|uniref:hypothetical protein n=1 Tax=Flavobacterium pectinovorum TaxID=29533 RepID=UPI001FAB9A90|nr:hypothetical protein [Flavobacterium pectinovorum]MCI9844060.1 hypothetical protein [Flavobacterium pectinovorum]